MAKQLYDYWFVQFDFPNEEGKTYKSSGEVMVYNERLRREIPQGWSTMPISEILDKYPTTKRYETKEYLSCGKYPIIDQGDSYIVGFTNEVDHLLTRHPAVLFGDHSTKVKFLDFEFARGADGTQILYSSSEAVSQYYLYLAVSALQIPNPGYSRHFKYLKELPIIIPDLKIANKFKNIVKPLFEEWTKNIFCNIELTKQRNELLPLLMNGQVSVNSIVFENEHNREFVYFALKLYFENAKGKTGNVFANMSKDEFASIKMVYPPKQILQGFHNKVVAIFDNIKNNIGEINALTKQRDELLPLLMNGQAMVNSDLSDD